MSRHPQIQVRQAWQVACTVCSLDSYGDHVPTFASEQEMWEVMLSSHNYGWTRRDDGRILCRHHSAVAACDVEGHQRSRWVEHPLDEALDWRYCTRCGGRFQQRIAAKPRHPE